MAVFKDKSHLPEVVEYEIREDGRIGNETSRDLPDGITRELQIDISMDRKVAILIRDWLSERIKELTPPKTPGD